MPAVTVFNPRGHPIDGLSDPNRALAQPTQAHSPQGTGKNSTKVNATPSTTADGRTVYSVGANGI